MEFKEPFLLNKRALIVDDNKTNLEILSHNLGKSNMESVPTHNPHDVIPILKQGLKENRPFDICIIDIQMPRISGYDLAQQIRQLEPPLATIPLLAFSSSTLHRSQKFKNAGFDGFLPKPIRGKKLIKMIARLLGLGSLKEERKHDIITQHSIIEENKHSIQILLAEDNPINAKLAVFILEKAGYQVAVAHNGREVIDVFCADPFKFDLILMDVQMPEMDGRKATQILRKKGFKDIPIIAMTAEAMKGDREKSIAAGMDDYIAKPIKREMVFQIVKKWCLEK